MTSDVGSGATSTGGFFPPSVAVVPTVPPATMAPTDQSGLTLAQRVAAVPGLTQSELQAADPTSMSATLLHLWAAMTIRPFQELASGELHEDGSVRISSQIAVWLIGRISEAYGQRKLVNLSRVKDVESLRSLRGLTRLLVAVINADMGGSAA